MYAENLSKRENVSDLISMRMILNDSLSTFNDVSKARTHVALLWASQANTLPATFWSLFYMIRYAVSSLFLYCVGSQEMKWKAPTMDGSTHQALVICKKSIKKVSAGSV